MATAPFDGTLVQRGPTCQDGADLQEPIEVVGQRLGTGITALGSLRQAFQADRVQVTRDARPASPGRDRLVGDDALQGLELALAAERRAAGQKFVQDRPQPIDVGRRPDPILARLGLLGGHVWRRAGGEHRPRLVPFDVHELGQAEVAEPRHEGESVAIVDGRLAPAFRADPLARVQEHVGRLEVEVEDAPLVGVLHGPGQGGHQPRRHPRIDRPLPTLQPVRQARPIHEHRGDVGGRPGPPGLQDRHEVGMVQPRRRPGLAKEPTP